MATKKSAKKSKVDPITGLSLGKNTLLWLIERRDLGESMEESQSKGGLAVQRQVLRTVFQLTPFVVRSSGRVRAAAPDEAKSIGIASTVEKHPLLTEPMPGFNPELYRREGEALELSRAFVQILANPEAKSPGKPFFGRPRCAQCYRARLDDEKFGRYCHRCGSNEELT